MFILPQNQSYNGYHSNRQEDILQVLYQRLSYFLMTGEHSNKEIMEEIERQISDLKQEVKHCLFVTILQAYSDVFQLVNSPIVFWQNALKGDRETREVCQID